MPAECVDQFISNNKSIFDLYLVFWGFFFKGLNTNLIQNLLVMSVLPVRKDFISVKKICRFTNKRTVAIFALFQNSYCGYIVRSGLQSPKRHPFISTESCSLVHELSVASMILLCLWLITHVEQCSICTQG